MSEFFRIILDIVVPCISAITIICAFLKKVLENLLAPVKKLDKRLDEIEKDIKSNQEHLDNDNKRLNLHESDIKLLLKDQRLLLDREVHGDHREDLKDALTEMNRYVIER